MGDKYGALVEWYWQGETKVFGEKLVPLPICTPKISQGLPRHFFFSFSCSLFVLYPYLLLGLDCPAVWLSSLLYNTHDTNVYASGGVRTLNPSRWAATDLRPRPHGHRDRLRTQAFAVEGRQLTTWSMTRPLGDNPGIYIYRDSDHIVQTTRVYNRQQSTDV